jgi:hypothetical protein
MVKVMRHDGAKALVHSGGRLLSVEEVARAAVAMIGGRRVIRTIPAWRGPLIRVGNFAPSRSGGAFRLFERLGHRVVQRRAG